MSTIVDDHEHVAVFWDYENCTPPTTVPGYDITNNIREIAHKFGSVKQFKAYLELSEQSSSKSLNLRSELQSCGVSLTDCPHNGRKEVADKMMIVDMLTYAIDTPAPATLVLITGDRDFVYAVSVLRLRKYRVVLVAPNTTHTSLRSQASEVLDWDGDVLRKTSKDARHTRVDPSRVRAQSTSVLMCSSPPAQRRPHRPSFRDNSSETVQLTVTRDDGHSRSASMDTGPISHHSIRTTLTRDVDASGSSQQAVADTEHSDIESEDIEHILDLDVYLKKLQNPSSNGESSTVDPSSMLIPSMRCVAACPGPSVVQQIQSDVMQDEVGPDLWNLSLWEQKEIDLHIGWN
ncbi:NYN domain-containing protein [Sparassis latifolia]